MHCYIVFMYFHRISTEEKFYILPKSGSDEVLEIDRLNFDLSLVGEFVYTCTSM